jgi:hypothetical protein
MRGAEPSEGARWRTSAMPWAIWTCWRGTASQGATLSEAIAVGGGVAKLPLEHPTAHEAAHLGGHDGQEMGVTAYPCLWVSTKGSCRSKP